MIELKQIVECFVPNRDSGSDGESPTDGALLNLLHDPDADLDACARELLAWLHRYKALLFYPPEASAQIATIVVDFCRSSDRLNSPLSKCDLLEEFAKLQAYLYPAVPNNPRSQTRREITSLASKALWCCYPCDVPLLDDYSERALQVLSRLSGITTAPDQSRYETFVDVWFQVFERVESMLETESIGRFPSKVRALDRVLWHLGQPSFEYGATI